MTITVTMITITIITTNYKAEGFVNNYLEIRNFLFDDFMVNKDVHFDVFDVVADNFKRRKRRKMVMVTITTMTILTLVTNRLLVNNLLL